MVLMGRILVVLGLISFSFSCEDSGETLSGAPQEVADVEAGEEPDSSSVEERIEEKPLQVEVLSVEGQRAPKPAQLIFARLTGSGLGEDVIVEGIQRETLTFVDPDETLDESFPFRVRVENAGGERIWQTTIREPIQVREFLGNAGLEEMGIDPLKILPEVGDFVFAIPTMEDAERVIIERIEVDGTATTLGDFVLAEIPEMPPYEYADALVTKIVGTAPASEALDIVIVGDGYTEAEMGLFKKHAGKISTAFTTAAPYSNYFKRLNFYRVDVPSEESGASYDCSDSEVIENCVDAYRDTAFGSIFPLRLGVLLGMEVSDRAIFQLKQWSVYQAAALAPFDTIVILVNTKKYGAFGIYNASLSAYLDNLGKVAVHEMGHSFALLGDEYVVEGDICQAYLLTPDYPNISPAYTEPEDVKWEAWLTPGVQLPTVDEEGWADSVGLFQGAGAGCSDFYRPKKDCLMRSSSSEVPLCPICKEATIHRLYAFFDFLSSDGLRVEGGTLLPAHSYGQTPTGEWRVNGELAGSAGEPLSFERPAPGESVEIEVELDVWDGTQDVRRHIERLREHLKATVRVTAPE